MSASFKTMAGNSKACNAGTPMQQIAQVAVTSCPDRSAPLLCIARSAAHSWNTPRGSMNAVNNATNAMVEIRRIFEPNMAQR